MSRTDARATSDAAVEAHADPLFIDTGAFFAYYNDRDKHHERTRTVFHAIQSGELAYEPLYTTRFVLAELTTLLLYKIDQQTASRALGEILTANSINVIRVDSSTFTDARTAFDQYDDQTITLVNHLTAVLAGEYETEYVFAFDSDFSTLGLTRVPVDTSLLEP